MSPRQRPREGKLTGSRPESAPCPEEPQFRVELDDPVVDVVGDIRVAAPVQGDAVGEAELAGAGPLAACGPQEVPVAVELLDPVIEIS